MIKPEIFIDNRQSVEIEEDLINGIEIAVAEVLVYENQDMEVEVSVSFVDNLEIQRLNKEFRNIDRETDVLSFPSIDEFEFDFEIKPRILGDIVISMEKSKEQAIEYNHSFKREVIYLTVHSMLHLLGYDHMQEDEKKIMRSKEKDIMNKLGIFK